MSSLNLNPNPTIIAIEAGVFLLNFIAVKKLFLEPFLQVQAERSRMTEGSQSQAEQLEKDNEEKVKLIRQRLNSAANDSREKRDQTLSVAKKQRDELLAVASKEASEIVGSMRQELSRELETERARIPALVQGLTRDFVQKLVPA